MANDTLKIIQSIVGADLYATTKKATNSKGAKTPLVTISRFYGAGSGDVSRLLAERLSVQFYDKDLLKAIVKDAKADKHLLNRLDERVINLADELLHSFFSKKSTNKDSFLRYMAKVILGIGPSGGVIIGRGAHLILPKERTFRIRLEGSMQECVKRVAKRKSMKKSKAEKLIKKMNKERDSFQKDLAKRYPTSIDSYDITLNTDSFTPQQCVDIIVLAMREVGFKIPPQSKKSA
ncbi:MAG: cytidylate kinase-like family protein [Magnetococcales bacterium]|nr:cytidylate kinase-like family protein [Magnetococcales bacterium]